MGNLIPEKTKKKHIYGFLTLNLEILKKRVGA